jgi:ABC-2 type transport system ATP-binding protein
MLKVINLQKSFGNIKAVDNVDMFLEQGSILGLLGPNGAGKSTTINMLSTISKPDGGQILYNGIDILSSPGKYRQELGVVPQSIALYTDISGLDNLKFWGSLYGLKGKELLKRIDEVSEIIGINDRLKSKVKEYSGGMQRRLNIGCSLLHNPKLLLMDEPTVGIDPQSRFHILDTVKVLNEKGMTIIYTSHYMEEVEYLAKNIMIMDLGKIIASGDKNDLLKEVSDYDEYRIHIDDTLGLNGISNIEHYLSHSYSDSVLTLKMKKNGNNFAIISKYFLDMGINIGSFEHVKPNLEKVFLKLTGKALRD